MPIFLEGERVVVTIPSCGIGPNLSPNALTTTLIIKDLLLNKSQVQISDAVHHFMGTCNMTSITYYRAQEDKLGRHNRVATVRCLNSLVYSHWVNKSDISLFGKIVDFVPHKCSLTGSVSNQATGHHNPPCLQNPSQGYYHLAK
jgi:hypothetical protein